MAPLLVLLVTEYAGVTLTVLADLVSGLRKSRREGRTLTSRGFRRTVRKLVSYYLALFSMSVVDVMVIAAGIVYASSGEESVLPSFPFLSTFGSISLALIEIKSICENSPENTDFSLLARMVRNLLSGKKLL